MTSDAGAAGSSRRTRRPGTVITVAAATVLLVGGGTAAAVGLAGRDAVTPPPLEAAAPQTGSPAPSAPAPSAPGGSASSVRAPASTPTPVQTAPPAPAAVPVQVSIPSIGVTSPLLHLGLQADGTLDVPRGNDFDSAAWYDGSPRPGDTGPAVIEGHVSSRANGPSVFFSLSTVAVGDRVDVLREDGTTVTFEVYDVKQFPKSGFPTLDVYGNTPGPELRIITCGGTIAESSGHFTDNIVVFAHVLQA